MNPLYPLILASGTKEALFAPVAAFLYDRTRDEIAVLRFELEQYKQLHAYYAEKAQ